MILLWAGVVVVGMAAAIVASRRAVRHASALAFGSKIPPFVIGITLVALGTDLPEIAHAVIAAIGGFGDLVVGDAVGSTITQMTLVLGLLPLIGGSIVIGRERILWPGVAIGLSLLVGAALLADGRLSRGDGWLLIGLWLAASALLWRHGPPAGQPAMTVPSRGKAAHAAAALGALAVVGGGATAAVVGFVEIAELLGVPQFLIAFFAASVGTSLPELVVDVTALRARERDLAVGDILGSSLVDATLALGLGGVVAPLVVDTGLAMRSVFGGIVAIGLIVALLSRVQSHSRLTGVALIGLYAAFYPLLILG